MTAGIGSLGADAELLAHAEAGAADASGRDAFVVDVDGFEGPLHLLLELAQRQKVDLARVSIAALADQYLAFIRDAADRRIDLAGDYLLMAAWLAWLKSKLLLPSPAKVEEGAAGEDAAQRLSFRLRRLDVLRRAGEALMERPLDGRDVFRRGAPERPTVMRMTAWDASLYALITAFANISARRVKSRAHVVRRQPVLTLETARRRLLAFAVDLEDWRAVDTLRAAPEDAPDAPERSIRASFFSAALELARDRTIDIRQDRPMAELYVRGIRVASKTVAE